MVVELHLMFVLFHLLFDFRWKDSDGKEKLHITKSKTVNLSRSTIKVNFSHIHPFFLPVPRS